MVEIFLSSLIPPVQVTSGIMKSARLFSSTSRNSNLVCRRSPTHIRYLVTNLPECMIAFRRDRLLEPVDVVWCHALGQGDGGRDVEISMCVYQDFYFWPYLIAYGRDDIDRHCRSPGFDLAVPVGYGLVRHLCPERI